MTVPRATSHIRTDLGKGENALRRFFTTKEEDVLLQCLEQLHAEGVKLDGSLRGGYVIRVVNLMEEKLPGCGIIPTHVRSKISVWRKTHFACLIILAASGASGFGFDPTSKMFIEEKPGAWDEHAKVYSEGVKLLKGKTFPWLHRWNILFGTDKATGKNSVDICDAVNELLSSSHKDSQPGIPFHPNDTQSTNSNNVVDVDDESKLPQDVDEYTESKRKGKRKRSNEEDTSKIEKLMGDIMNSTRTAIGDVAAALKQPPPAPKVSSEEDDGLKASLYESLCVLQGLTLEEIMWSVSYLANNRNDMLAFYGMPAEVRAAFILMLTRKAK